MCLQDICVPSGTGAHLSSSARSPEAQKSPMKLVEEVTLSPGRLLQDDIVCHRQTSIQFLSTSQGYHTYYFLLIFFKKVIKMIFLEEYKIKKYIFN